MIKMVVSDMDGTLLNTNGQISEKNLEAIHRLTENHIEFVIASGRDYQGVYSILNMYHLECEAILGNGSQYVDKNGNILMDCYMDKSTVIKVVDIFRKLHIPYMIFSTDGFYTGEDPSAMRMAFITRSQKKFGGTLADFEKGGKLESMPCNQLQKIDDFHKFINNDREIMKVEAFSIQDAEAEAAKEALKFVSGISYLSSFNDNLEVTDESAQKGYILEKVIQLKGLSKEEIMVAGDGMNDLSMFQLFPHSYAPSNAHVEIKQLASEIVCSNEEDGFAQAVYMILEKNTFSCINSTLTL